MALSQEQKDLITAWRKDKGIDRCLACGYDGEMACGEIAIAPVLPPDGVIQTDVDTDAIGMVPVACPECGYMMLFHPVTLGLISSQ
jgi:hypothetical protein